MSAHFSAKDPFFSPLANGSIPSCNIRGRMVPFPEFLPRLKNYCLSLGFLKPAVLASECSAAGPALPEIDGKLLHSDDDLVIILSTRVLYKTSWGVYGGLSSPLLNMNADPHPDGTIASFIAPYLLQYQFAQNHIYLARKDGQYFITLPSSFLCVDKEHACRRLKILLDKIVAADDRDRISFLGDPDSLSTFKISEQFARILRENHFPWKGGRVQRIGALLSTDLFVFEEGATTEGGNGIDSGESPFSKTLLPVMNRIVTHPHPQLLAATIHLQSEFSETVDRLLAARREERTENLFCIAGLDIDVAALRERGERYFVPLSAYWHRHETPINAKNHLDQDALFVALMAQDKQSPI